MPKTNKIEPAKEGNVNLSMNQLELIFAAGAMYGAARYNPDWEVRPDFKTYIKSAEIQPAKESQPTEDPQKYMDRYLAICEESAQKCPEGMHPVAQSAWMEGYEKAAAFYGPKPQPEPSEEKPIFPLDIPDEVFKEASTSAYLSPEVVYDAGTSSAYIQGFCVAHARFSEPSPPPIEEDKGPMETCKDAINQFADEITKTGFSDGMQGYIKGYIV